MTSKASDGLVVIEDRHRIVELAQPALGELVCIPQPNDRRLPLVAEDAERARVEREVPSRPRIQSEPARGEDAQHVPM